MTDIKQTDDSTTCRDLSSSSPIPGDSMIGKTISSDDGCGDLDHHDDNDDVDSESGGGMDPSSSVASVASVDTGTSPSTNPEGNRAMLADEESVSIARKENHAVLVWRMVVFGVLLASTIGVAVGVYFFVDKGEQEEFNTQFEDDSFKTLEALGNSLDLKLGAIDAFIIPMVSYSMSANKSWPYVTVPDHAVRASKTRSLSSAINIEQYHIVKEENRAEWEAYASRRGVWVQESLAVQAMDETFQGPPVNPSTVVTNITTIQFDGVPVPPDQGLYAPTWQSYPIVTGVIPYNTDVLQHPKMDVTVATALQDKKVVISRVLNIVDPDDPHSQESVDATNEWAAQFVKTNDNDGSKDPTEPLVRFVYPVLDTASMTVTASVNTGRNSAAEVVAFVATTFYWSSFLMDILPAGEIGLVVVFENACDQSFTYQINGPDVVYLGEGDLHDTRYSDRGMMIGSSINDLSDFNTGEQLYSGLPLSEEFCSYTVTTYASQTMESESRSSDPIVFSIIAVLIFAFTSVVFLAYDKLVSIRQYKVMKTAVRSAAIVSSLFPSNVRERVYNHGQEDRDGRKSSSGGFQPTKTLLKSFLSDGATASESSSSDVLPGSQFSGKPIADLFTDCTVFFCDIANFTAWSSVREPGQVFVLLESIYGAFDAIAARRGVFKVETIGDSYVAVVGLPERCNDHAAVMAKFARDCREKFHELCGKLETFLGPETAELGVRIGLHSGPVTAGVLRGQKSRFQLFGDTVNTAARMESTGCVNRIQVSQATADLLIKAEKSHWLQAREEKVEAKGKGFMQTYWVEPKSRAEAAAGAGDSDPVVEPHNPDTVDTKTKRLVKWNVDVLARLLQKIVARRNHLNKGTDGTNAAESFWEAESRNAMVLDEVQEIIELPAFDPLARRASGGNYGAVVIDSTVLSQLRELVLAIAQTYHKNPFHSFEHASHVCMSVAKLMSRIVAPDREFANENQLHDHTYGITSDPLTQFACVFAALIHDVDHQGISNTQLVKEGSEIAEVYKGKSVAEQNSVNMAWGILMDDKYADLRYAICATQEEVSRFRHLVINAVMATDIMDKDLKKLRDTRWNCAFSENPREEEPDAVGVNRKATIVIEHLIQASDVCHTMQHWHIYRKWNERLFLEMRKAYMDGRSEKDPASFWYAGEIGFFDFYVIPLAKKLSECGVFGVSSDEYLNYAVMNRNEWEKKGQAIVADYVSSSEGHFKGVKKTPEEVV